MKISTRLTKLIGMLAIGLLCSDYATAKIPQKEKIEIYFSNRLAGKVDCFESNKVLKLSKIEKSRSMVWQAWQSANANLEEQKLIALEPLESAKTGSWNLPSNLEPNAVMPYYFGSKGALKSDEKYPLFLYMHGSGSKAKEWQTGLAICKRFQDSSSVYFIPQIPNEGNYYRWWQRSKQYAWEKMLRQAFLTETINPNKIYFFGISEGGYGSQRLASFYADYLAAAGPIAGGEPLKNAPVENCRNIAFSLRTGALDSGFYREKLTRYTKEEFSRFAEKNPGAYHHNIEIIPEKGHSIDYAPTTPWLKQYTRDPYPKSVSWENFEMDGRYREGFYNLWVRERSNDDNNTRTHYEMVIIENKITLRVDLVEYKTTEVDPHWGIALRSEKHYTPATKGKVVVYLCPELVDLSKEVVLTVNGREAFRGVVKPELRHLVNSCAAYFDPQRLYPAAIEVDIEELK